MGARLGAVEQEGGEGGAEERGAGGDGELAGFVAEDIGRQKWNRRIESILSRLTQTRTPLALSRRADERGEGWTEGGRPTVELASFALAPLAPCVTPRVQLGWPISHDIQSAYTCFPLLSSRCR